VDVEGQLTVLEGEEDVEVQGSRLVYQSLDAQAPITNAK
jgi:hypothetical protein